MADTNARVSLVVILLTPFVAGAAGYAVMRSQDVTGQSITLQQPVSHAHHAGRLGIDCRYCHASVETATFAEIAHEYLGAVHLGLCDDKTAALCQWQPARAWATAASARSPACSGSPLCFC